MLLSKYPSSSHVHSAKLPASKTSTSSASSDSGEKSAIKPHKRSRSGCFTCRLRRKKCDEGHPSCKACTNLSLKCEYKRPMWWASAEQRRMQKERVKNKIKQTKMVERRGSGQGPSPASPPLTLPGDYDYGQSSYNDFYDPFAPQIQSAPFHQNGFHVQFAPYEVDVRTERQTFVNDVPLRHDSSVSTFSAMGPPQLQNTLPNFHGNDWLQEDCFVKTDPYDQQGPSYNYQMPVLQSSNIEIEEHDQPFLDHFLENVLRMIFPISEVHQQGITRANSILTSLETNKSYLHCCLSVAAIHLKSTVGLEADQIDHDIMRHRYEAISQLCQALSKDTDHEQILDSTLAMIFFHCSVGAPDDCLPDIPWDDHFQAVTNLVNRLGAPSATAIPGSQTPAVNPFSMSLATWIDILGATMLGKSPQFAHAYRTKHLSGTSSGLRELMGCDDRVMYLISEIACLDSLKAEGRIDDLTVCHHVSALGAQLEYTEPATSTLEHPYNLNGTLRPEQLTETMTAIFRSAARIYLCSLVPGFDRSQSSTVSLVASITSALQFIPAGPYGFDRSLVWPLLIAGAFSTPESDFRAVLAERAAALGDVGDFGSFSRMFRVVQEVWRLTDGLTITPSSNEDSKVNQEPALEHDVLQTSGNNAMGMRPIKQQSVHWRDIMLRNDWRYLLI
ncbi:Transcription factor NosA-like protein [Penicillium ucsense]|uniref:Transcription factor NosA-like protein n=1 Tax=Penicillium ucsense TaxID=2839758 RepID=A0A8J8WGN8_9EURO|nr:Transcription factor NosA-like protein [Penicillium ucsense]KAF7734446.1 Transcription factor NosA-like protein [Penicillium ucsense]